MTVALSKEDREVMDDLYQSIISFKQGVLQLSIYILVELKKYIWNFIISLGEFSPQELKQHGLEEILMRRALRFFGLSGSEKESGDSQVERKSKPSVKTVLKKVVILLLSPFYILILICLYIRRRGKNNYVKNNYKT